MSEITTLDASVFVSAFTPSESFHANRKAFMRQMQAENHPIVVPTLVIPEIEAVLSRGQNKPDLGIALPKKLPNFPT